MTNAQKQILTERSQDITGLYLAVSLKLMAPKYKGFSLSNLCVEKIGGMNFTFFDLEGPKRSLRFAVNQADRSFSIFTAKNITGLCTAYTFETESSFVLAVKRLNNLLSCDLT